jgi:ABC-type Fe3+ transport system permease subunit
MELTEAFATFASVIMCIGLALWMSRELFESLRTGRFGLRYGGYVIRKRTPGWFWVAVTFKTLLIALCFFFVYLGLTMRFLNHSPSRLSLVSGPSIVHRWPNSAVERDAPTTRLHFSLWQRGAA